MKQLVNAEERTKSSLGLSQPKPVVADKKDDKDKKRNQVIQPHSYFSANPKQMYTNAVTKFAFATKTGISPSNPNKVNQDMWITVPHFCGMKFCHFFSVADGHG